MIKNCSMCKAMSCWAAVVGMTMVVSADNVRVVQTDGSLKELSFEDVSRSLDEPQQFCDERKALLRQSPFDTVYNEVVRADLAADRSWTKLKTADEIRVYQRFVRERAVAAMGGFPEKTPLNPVTVGVVRREGYSIEKLYFESRPKCYVTAHLFLPDPTKFTGPCPGVILPCGHYFEGKAARPYQRGAMLLARAGFAVLVYDPIDQGERYQRRPKPENWSSCGEHNRLGVRAHLLGSSAAMWRLWDGIRAIDYLCSRRDVDGARIGVMGQSGGGTLTSLIMAFDDRVKAAAPSSYLSTIRAVGALCGPQDAEQNVYGQLRFGLNHLGLIALRAPSPVMIAATHTDFFPFFGTIETYEQAQELFDVFGVKDNVFLSEAEGSHSWCESQRQATLLWMRRHLAGDASATIDSAALRQLNVGFDLDTADCALAGTPAARVAPDGWAMNLPAARSDYDVMRDEAEKQFAHRASLTTSALRAVTGIRPLAELKCRQIGATLVRDDLTRLPTVLFRGQRGGERQPVLIVSDVAKRSELAQQVFGLLKQGRTVMVAEVRAFGETGANRSARKWGFYGSKHADEELAVTLIWLGEALVARRAEDVALAAKALSDACGGVKVELVAQGRAAIPAAHTYALERQLFSRIAFERKPPAWKTVFENADVDCGFADTVYGAYGVYDWADLSDGTLGE